MSSNVYVSADIAVPIDLQLTNCGPDEFPAHLMFHKIKSRVTKAKIMEIERHTHRYAVLDVAFFLSGIYAASFGVMVRGHQIGSSIWWRSRTASTTLNWVGGHHSHDFRVQIGANAFNFSMVEDQHWGRFSDYMIKIRSSK
ncbi:hypothetical protein WI697_24790 [Tistrella mobilis]|uniref:hypothetical protein n=1 Tax=Tistrella mobilis TaxID=171437 RepID=UPI0031F694A3